MEKEADAVTLDLKMRNASHLVRLITLCGMCREERHTQRIIEHCIQFRSLPYTNVVNCFEAPLDRLGVPCWVNHCAMAWLRKMPPGTPFPLHVVIK